MSAYRESAQSWREVLLDLKRRGLAIAPALATGDGSHQIAEIIQGVKFKHGEKLTECAA
ncbi:MAG: hypothetical protein IID50_12545 [Proteobacteria bacterium]|nr:hypothetical protein [Pseudomonadota bacterium]